MRREKRVNGHNVRFIHGKHDVALKVLVTLRNVVGQANAHIREILAAQRARTRAGFLRCVNSAKEAGILASDTDVQALARFFHSFEIGLSTEARDGATGKELDAAVLTAMKTWDAAVLNAVD